MITFKQFMSEEEKLTIEEWVKQNCSGLVKEFKGHAHDVVMSEFALYRGINSTSSEKVQFSDVKAPAYIMKVRSDRKPSDTALQIHKMVDEELHKRFGWYPRSSSVFCFGKAGLSFTDDFGPAFRIYPMGEIKYIWNPEVTDLYGTLGQMRRKDLELAAVRRKDVLTNDEVEAWRKALQPVFDGYKYTGLEECMTHTRPFEIMMGCKEYLAIEN